MVHWQQMEHEKHLDNNREVKRDKTSDKNFSYTKSDGQVCQRSKQRFPNKGLSSDLRV